MRAGARGRGVGGGVVGVLVAAVATACAGAPTGPVPLPTHARPPLSANSLRDRLLPSRLPHGWSVRAAAVNPAPGSPAGVVPPPGCQALLGEDVVDDSATAAGSSASARLAGGRGANGDPIPGTETLYAFPGQGAHAALAAMRALARRCGKQVSTDGTTTVFSTATGPALGDESLTVRTEQTYRAAPGTVRYADATVVRVGPFLVVLSTVPMDRADAAQVAALMPLAVTRFRGTTADSGAQHGN